jgi:hypothetical protein
VSETAFITTQAQLLAALAADPNARLEINATARLSVDIAIGSPLLKLFGATVLRLIAWESSQPHVEAWDSSQPHVEAWESSQPHVVAKAYAQVSLSGSGIKASATTNVALLLKRGAQATGGHQTTLSMETPMEWCEYYGIEIVEDVAILYKALNADFVSPRGMRYAPGDVPVALDWDGGKVECGCGLHFSPSPLMALEFNGSATKFAGCPVRLSDIAVHPDGDYPKKVKAKQCCGPCFEVDRNGRRIIMPTIVETAKSAGKKKAGARKKVRA